MKTNPDPDEDALLESVLGDDAWRQANAAAKSHALGVFQKRQRIRRWSRRAGAVAILAVFAAGAIHRLNPPAPARLALKPPQPPSTTSRKPNYLTDQQLLALFPEGSCFLAEVDGKKKLVFFDPKVEREYISDAGGSRSFAP